MVQLSVIQQSNAQIDQSHAPRTAVFMGGTSGIGKITLQEIAELGFDFTAYVIGRKETKERYEPFIKEVEGANPKTKIVWVEGEISLLAEVKRVCDYIKTVESRIDLLFLTAGYSPLGGRDETAEGLDTSQALQYYSRMCFVQNLLPQLRASGMARVVTVRHAGGERANMLDVNDLNLEKPSRLFAIWMTFHVGIMNTLFLESLAEKKENENIVFIHSHPGAVRTGNVYRGWKGWSLGMYFATYVMDPIMMLVQFSLKESAERYLYVVTSGTFGGRGPKIAGVEGRTTRGRADGGLFLSGKNCDTVTNEVEIAKLRGSAQDAVWIKTQEIIGPYV
ncbi:unnamed protein product [Periconia digitata]|uniref:Uncharacterized protein n=1 Tax=Periconia digitata TaxID=1303443 RepID=A0A9W4UK23_9PLEO|nr:unnamed protein product [Periconia digitata]